jgi:hypothetical protein
VWLEMFYLNCKIENVNKSYWRIAQIKQWKYSLQNEWIDKQTIFSVYLRYSWHYSVTFIFFCVGVCVCEQQLRRESCTTNTNSHCKVGTEQNLKWHQRDHKLFAQNMNSLRMWMIFWYLFVGVSSAIRERVSEGVARQSCSLLTLFLSVANTHNLQKRVESCCVTDRFYNKRCSFSVCSQSIYSPIEKCLFLERQLALEKYQNWHQLTKTHTLRESNTQKSHFCILFLFLEMAETIRINMVGTSGVWRIVWLCMCMCVWVYVCMCVDRSFYKCLSS